MLNIAFHILNYIMRVYNTNVTIYQQEKQDLLDLCDNQTSTITTLYTLTRENGFNLARFVRWFIGDFILTPQYFASSVSVNFPDSHFHRLPTISLHRVC